MSVKQQNVDELNAILTVTVGENDYKDKVVETLRKQQKTAKIDGFRPGKVPFSYVNKVYGTSVKVDVVNRLINDKIQQHLSENKINVLGQPLPKEDDKTFDWDTQKDFEFEFELGISPVFDINLTKKNKLTNYVVLPSEEIITNYVEDIKARFGNVINPDEVGEADMVVTNITELEGGAVKEGGVSQTSTINMSQVTNEKAKKALLGKKSGEAVEVDLKELGADIKDAVTILNIDEEVLAASEVFKVEITSISRMEKGELNQELFDKVYEAGTVKTEAEFMAKVTDEAKQYLSGHGDKKFKDDLVKYLVDKIKFDMPVDFLQKWLAAASENKSSVEDIKNDYDKYDLSLRWQLIENKIITENDLKVAPEEVVTRAKELIAANFAQYGQMVPDEELEKYAQNVLQKEEERRRLFEELYFDKIVEVVKEKCNIEEKEISFDEFIKLDETSMTK